MFHETSVRVTDWANSVLGESIATLGSPSPSADGATAVRIMLLDARPSATRPGVRVDVLLRYLVTAEADRDAEAHRRLGHLMFAAMTHADFHVEKEPVSLEFWKVLGLTPRPSLVVSVIASRDRHRIEGATPTRLVASTAPTAPSRPMVERRSGGEHTAGAHFNRRATDRRRATETHAMAG